MGNSDLKSRTKRYALSVIKLFSELPKRTEAQIIGRQLLRSATSVGAQYREGTRAKSDPDFISKIEGSLQELEESEYWLELLEESGFLPEERLASIKKETGELKGMGISLWSEGAYCSSMTGDLMRPRKRPGLRSSTLSPI
jgi:four helix bundle protein